MFIHRLKADFVSAQLYSVYKQENANTITVNNTAVDDWNVLNIFLC